jgi:hypothetical protein
MCANSQRGVVGFGLVVFFTTILFACAATPGPAPDQRSVPAEPIRRPPPEGPTVVPGVVIEGPASLCCARRLSDPDAVPVLLFDCTLLPHESDARMMCYESGREAFVATGRVHGRNDGVVEVFADVADMGASLESHGCQASIRCPGMDKALTCQGTGPAARCEQTATGVLCAGTGPEQVFDCPKAKP